MFEELQSFFSRSEVVAAAVLGMAMAMFKAARILGSTLELHERYFVRKRHKRLQELRGSINEGAFTRYFDEAIELEAFRIEFGVLVCQKKARILLKLMEQGYWDYIQIRNVARFLIVTPDQPVPIIKITQADRVGAWTGLVVGVLTIFGGGALWVAISLISQSLYAYLAGAGLFCMCTLASVLFASGYGRYKNAQSVKNYLFLNPEFLTEFSLVPPSNLASTKASRDIVICGGESALTSKSIELVL